MGAGGFPYKNVQQYLDAMGVLETGSDIEITEARKTFRKLYLKHYRKYYGKGHASVNLSFSRRDKQLLKQLAAENGKKLASFIKTIALDHLNPGTTGQQTTVDLSELKRLFSLGYDIVEELREENGYPQLKSSYDRLGELFEQMETLLDGH